jgi:hypothetical protein
VASGSNGFGAFQRWRYELGELGLRPLATPVLHKGSMLLKRQAGGEQRPAPSRLTSSLTEWGSIGDEWQRLATLLFTCARGGVWWQALAMIFCGLCSPRGAGGQSVCRAGCGGRTVPIEPHESAFPLRSCEVGDVRRLGAGHAFATGGHRTNFAASRVVERRTYSGRYAGGEIRIPRRAVAPDRTPPMWAGHLQNGSSSVS